MQFHHRNVVDDLFIRIANQRRMFPYEDLIVYKKAYESNRKIYRLIKGKNKLPAYARNQLGRASLSVMLNIAEGSAKFSNRDRRNFYITARGSAFESASLLNFLFDEGEVEKQLKQDLCREYEEISRILFTMINNLPEK